MITPEAMIDEIKRELAMRKMVYPSQIRNGKLTKMEANKRYLTLQAIIPYIKQESLRRSNSE